MEDNSQWTPIVVEQQEELKSQLTRCQERLAVAIAVLQKLSKLGGGRSDGNRIASDGLDQINGHTPSEYVAVRREDLSRIEPLARNGLSSWRLMKIADHEDEEAYNRLKALLEPKT